MDGRWLRAGIGAGAAAAATAALITLGQAGSSAATGAAAAKGTRLVFDSTVAQTRTLDADPKGPSLGDRTVLSENLSVKGKTVGADGIECVVTRVTKAKGKVTGVASQCLATLDLRRAGQITAQGLNTFRSSSGSSFDLAVTGGTGRYLGAAGTLTVRSTSATTSKLVVKLDR